MTNYLGLINSSRRVLRTSVICFIIIIIKHSHMTPLTANVTSKTLTLNLNFSPGFKHAWLTVARPAAAEQRRRISCLVFANTNPRHGESGTELLPAVTSVSDN
jgi:hypothetical protein